MSRQALIAALAIVTGLASATGARADAIDGEWCNGVQSFKIEGPSIITPAGRTLQGYYTRHTFSYVVPADEPQPGSAIDMQLWSEEKLTLTRREPGSDAPSKPEEWRRCRVTS